MIGGSRGEWNLLLAFIIIGILTTVSAIIYGAYQFIRWIL